MLLSLSVRDVVLIDKLDLSFGHGLSIFTGETGAGKSILLDALSLALGARSDVKLIRHGKNECQVIAVFAVKNEEVKQLLTENSISFDEEIILRRIVSTDGKSKAYINDLPVSISLLKEVGDLLIEIHGQFESHSLLNSITHKEVLDNYAKLEHELYTCKNAYENMQNLKTELDALTARIQKAKEDEEYLCHSVKELDMLNPKKGEEEELAGKRAFLMNAEKMMEYIKSAHEKLIGQFEVDRFIRDAEIDLKRAEDVLKKSNEESHAKRISEIAENLNNASDKLAEAVQGIEHVMSDIDGGNDDIEAIEERLFSLRELARKHRVMVDDLPELLEKIKADLGKIEFGEDELKQKKSEYEIAKKTYYTKAEELHKKRVDAGKILDKLVLAELAPLKLEKASIETKVEIVDEKNWTADGIDTVHFYVSTNPGTPKELINKIASGGELSRFMLALKVVLSQSQTVPTYIFDEVDTGISGATASAVGERLSRLSKSIQVLVITHSAQVAAFGDHHFKVLKHGNEQVQTNIVHLKNEERVEEIARIISSDKITEEALMQAKNLLGKK